MKLIMMMRHILLSPMMFIEMVEMQVYTYKAFIISFASVCATAVPAAPINSDADKSLIC